MPSPLSVFGFSNFSDGERSGNSPPTEGGQQPPRRSRLTSWLLWLLALGLLLWILAGFFSPGSSSRLTLSYDQFIAQVLDGNVSEVDISGQHLTGDLNQAIPSPASATATASAAPTTAKIQTYKQFQTTLPPFDDPNLLPLLQQKGVRLHFQQSGGNSTILSLVINLLFPVLLFGGLIFLMFRQTRGAQQDLFGFGRSKARVHVAEKSTVTFADVAGADDAKRELVEVVEFLRDPAKYAAIGASLPRGVLLLGPPGTGKTLMARAVAGEAGVPFFSISGSEFVEMFVGVGASRVRDLFDQAKRNAPCIIFIDELDAVGRQRGTGLGGGNDEREQTLNQILVEMDGFDSTTNVIVLAATNRPDVLDPALLRPGRFDRQVTVGLPDKSGRQAILAVHTKGKPLAPEVDLPLIARQTPGFSGADLANLVNEAALSAARSGQKQITMKDFDAALEKIVFGTKQAVLLDEKERSSIAYHEGGHALVAWLTPGADPVTKITIVPHGRALGVTQQAPVDERHTYSRDYLLGRLAVMLGGRAAEEIVQGEPSTGAENDLQTASELARRMIGIWGMSDELGPVYFGLGEQEPFLGRTMAREQTYSDETAAAIDQAVQQLIQQAHHRATDLLTTHRSDLDALASALLREETLDGADVGKVLGTPAAAPV
jgi:cell division protease FtsH